MKSLLSTIALATMLASTGAFAQGSLTPPGAPAPTMKTLAQIEPRTPISSLPLTITDAGAYYLTTNLTGVSGTNGITIAANDVTLDLKGFSLVAAPGSIDGILVSGNRTNLWIGNGTVRGWSLDNINALNSQASVFTDLKIIGSGNVGLRSGTAAMVTRCTTIGNSQEGILSFDACQVSQCTARNNGASGIATGRNCRITDCQAQFNGYDGISTGSGGSISGCTTANNSVNGIEAGSSVLVAGCTAVGNTNSGIYTLDGCHLSQCTAGANRGYGIFAGPNCIVLACSSVANPGAAIGIVAGQSSTVRGCMANGNYIGIYIGFSVTAPNTTVESCVASGNAIYGILINADGCLFLNNTCDGNGDGINCTGSHNRIEGNHLANNSNTGIAVNSGSSLHNVVVRNSALTNSVQRVGYNVPPSANDIGPIGKAATATSPWANLQ